MLEKLYSYRYEIFFYSQIFILFGHLIIPSNIFENIVSPILFQVNVMAGILLFLKKNNIKWFLIILLIFTTLIISKDIIRNTSSSILNFIKMSCYFLIYTIITFQLIKQVWNTKVVSQNVIYGLISGYISLGLIGFFICLSIEMIFPNSYLGFIEGVTLTENVMYFSYVTLLTIGYGDVLPVTLIAQKSVTLIGLAGQMYLVIISAIVIGKYVSQDKKI